MTRATRWDKGAAIVLGPNEGESFWQPEPAFGYVTVKLSPYNTPSNRFSVLEQVLPPGGTIPEHAHERAEELLYVVSGSGTATIDGTEHAAPAGTTFWAGRWVRHSFTNTGSEDMKLFAMIFPPGLEDFLAGIGVPRISREPAPSAPEYPDNLDELLARVRFATPDQLYDAVGDAVAHLDRGPALAIGPDDGESYWQPSPAIGYATTKMSPYSFEGNFITMGVQVLEPGAVLPEHAHRRNEEVKYVLQGRGHARIDGVEYPVEPGTLAFTGRWVTHSYSNDGDDDMVILYVFAPPALEHLLAEIGRPRTPGEPRPAPFEPPASTPEILQRTGLVLPDEVNADSTVRR